MTGRERSGKTIRPIGAFPAGNSVYQARFEQATGAACTTILQTGTIILHGSRRGIAAIVAGVQIGISGRRAIMSLVLGLLAARLHVTRIGRGMRRHQQHNEYDSKDSHRSMIAETGFSTNDRCHWPL